jgi:hypothetical protein
MADARVVTITKLDDDQRLAFGFASVAATVDGVPVTDSYGDQIEPQTLEKAAYDYVENSRIGGVMHARYCAACGEQTVATAGNDGNCPECGEPLTVRKIASIVESFVATPDKLAALGLAEDSMPAGWWLGMRVHDDATWAAVKSGKLKAFSIGGRAKRTPLEEE